ncbi:hypothetical protein [Phenylobacterium sp.]|nr:hypothetical protein [Phenylobacterium sp.]HVI33757.1 hypothetical protein [Phenylobacterium sp.]
MSKTLTLPALRLVCFGGARALTNSASGEVHPEEIPVDLYD